MRKINYIVVHCTATAQTARVAAIKNYWKNTLGWRKPGYHYIVEADGHITRLLQDEYVANGVKGYNNNSIHVAYVGGISSDGKSTPLDTRTELQAASLEMVLCRLKKIYPMAQILGHRDFPNVKKPCPSFDAKKAYNHL